MKMLRNKGFSISKKSFTTAYIVTVFTVMFASATIWANTKPPSKSGKPDKVTIGWLEKVNITPTGMGLVAKIDTGAKTSSIRAEILELKQKEGKPWVRFKLTDKKGESHTLELPVERTARIKKHGGGLFERPVVKLGICLGKVYKEAEVNLASRMSFNYTILLGRTFLEDQFVVDVSRKFTRKPRCIEPKLP